VIISFALLISCGGLTHSIASGKLNNMKATDYFEGTVYIQVAEAIEAGRIPEIKRIIDGGIDINHIGNEGMSLLMWSIAKQRKNVVALLLELGADPNITTEKYNALWMAVILKDSDYLNTLLRFNGDVDSKNTKTGRSLIFEATLHGRLENLKTLMEKGADMNHQNISGNTVLNYSISFKAYNTSLVLLDLGVDPTIKNRWGNNALDLLEQFGDKGIEKGTVNYEYYLQLMKRITQEQ